MSACKRLWRRTLDTPFLTHFSLLGIRCSPASATPAPRSPSGGHPLLPPVVTRGRRSQASERHGANPTGGQQGAGGGSRLYKDELRIWPACPQGQRSTRPWLPCGVGDGLYEPGAGIRPSSPTAESPLLPSRARAAAPPRKCCLAVPPPASRPVSPQAGQVTISPVPRSQAPSDEPRPSPPRPPPTTAKGT